MGPMPGSASQSGMWNCRETAMAAPAILTWSGDMLRKNFPRQRILSLWFAELPCDRILRRVLGPSWRQKKPAQGSSLSRADAGGEPPLVVVAKIRNAQRIVSLTAPARALGLRRGEALADARARVPGLLAEEEAPELDAALLGFIADWCDRYTPLVALDGTDGLFLDITGCAHLFGGEDALLADVVQRLEAQGFTVRGALADTPGAAWAMARYGGGACVPPDGQETALAELPLAALRLESETVEGLERVGLTRVGDIAARPRAPLANRFGAQLVRRLDQAFGREGEPISPRFAAPLIVAERRFFEPIGRLEDVSAVTLSLAGQLCASLERRAEGGRAFELALYRVDGAVQKIAVGTSCPLRSAKRILALFAEKLKADESVLDAGYGYDLIRLAVLEAQVADPTQPDLSGCGRVEAEADFDGLIDRLGARLGLERVTRLLPVDRHLPESQTQLVPAAAVREEALCWQGFSSVALGGDDFGLGLDEPPSLWAEAEASQMPLERPLRLFDPAEPVEAVAMVPEGPPLRFRWRKTLYQVTRSEGPERIAPPWWVGAAELPSTAREGVTRDYFRIEDQAGRRFWLYREGLYARETVQPRWYLQGVFA